MKMYCFILSGQCPGHDTFGAQETFLETSLNLAQYFFPVSNKKKITCIR